MLGTRSAVAAAAANARGLTAVAGAERGPRKAASESRNSRASSPSACLDGEAADKSALRPGAAMTAISASAHPTTAAVRPKNLFKTGLLPLKCLLLARDPCREYLTLYPAVWGSRRPALARLELFRGLGEAASGSRAARPRSAPPRRRA